MKKLLAIVTISFALAFSVNAAESPITNEKAIEKLHEYFGLLDIQVYDCTSSAPSFSTNRYCSVITQGFDFIALM